MPVWTLWTRETFFILPEIEPPFVGRPASGLVTMPTMVPGFLFFYQTSNF
jgi:hypothetical protein